MGVLRARQGVSVRVACVHSCVCVCVCVCVCARARAYVYMSLSLGMAGGLGRGGCWGDGKRSCLYLYSNGMNCIILGTSTRSGKREGLVDKDWSSTTKCVPLY